MRPFGTFLAVGFLILTVGCGDSSSSTGYTSPTGRTAASGGLECKSQNCAAQDTYYTCAASKCEAQAKACFGPSYASGTFGGPCQSLIACTMACPCDANGDACILGCEAATTLDCATCAATIPTCAATNGCGTQPADCTPVSTQTSDAGTAKNDSSTVTGSGCAAAQACCTALGASLGATYGQECQAGIAGLTDAQCTAAMAAYQTYCP